MSKLFGQLIPINKFEMNNLSIEQKTEMLSNLMEKRKLDIIGSLGSSSSVDYTKRAYDIVNHIELWTTSASQKLN